ncbi:MAG: hypothetical protein JNL32_13830, partial [Candidatus Kapabacteria bacterium]|nr:hypothetical protein [Candidatus Kapabacteria bacterium]
TPNPNESSGPGYLYFTVHGERGSKIDITTSALSSNTAVATILDWWDYTDNGTAWNFLNSGANPNLTITNAGDATLGSAPGTDGYIGVRFDATVTAIATGTTTITGTVTISNYSI